MIKVDKYINEIIEELEGELTKIATESGHSRTKYIKRNGTIEGLITAIDIVKKYKSDTYDED